MRRNWRYYNVSRDENPQRENEMDSPSFEGFHSQLDCKLTNGKKKSNTANTGIVYKVRIQKQNRNDRKYSQTGITVKIHTNHDGIRTTAIMLRSNLASSEIASEASLRNYIDRLWVNN